MIFPFICHTLLYQIFCCIIMNIILIVLIIVIIVLAGRLAYLKLKLKKLRNGQQNTKK